MLVYVAREKKKLIIKSCEKNLATYSVETRWNQVEMGRLRLAVDMTLQDSD